MKTIKCITGVLVSILMACFVLSCSSDALTSDPSVEGNLTLDKNNLNKNGLDNRSTVEEDVEWEYWLDVDCDGWTDQLSGPVTAHVVTHYKDGEPIGTMYHTSGTIYSLNTDEIFTVSEVSFDTFAELSIVFHFNIRGNMGSHYIGRMIWNYEVYDPWTGTLITRKFLCLKNGGSN